MNARADAPVMRWAALALAACALAFAGWRVFTLGLADAFSRGAPAAALAWRPMHPEALLRRGEARLRSGHPTSARQFARKGIVAAPLDGRGYRLLARDAELQGDAARAATLYAIAAERGPRDLDTHAWLAARAIKEGDFATALGHFDRMLRVEPDLSQQLNAVMIPVAMQKDAQSALAAILAANPPWRLGFTLPMIREARDREALSRLMDRLRGTPPGITPEELATWLDRLAADRQWPRAYLVWAQSLSPEAGREIGNVYNGRFEFEPSGSGFDWRFGRVPGARIFRTHIAGANGDALGIAFEDRRVPFEHVRQLLALPPGHYRLSGRSRLDDLRTERGLVWNLTCADARPIGESEPFRGSHDWQAFNVDVVVPDTGCSGQWLLLKLPARIPAEQRIGGTAWFDDLKISAVRG